MKSHRGPQSNEQTTLTDVKKASEIAREWEPGGVLYFDGTIDKSGVRHTSIGIEIDDADIVSLATAFLRNYAEKRQEFGHQRQALQKIVNLSFKISDSPSQEAFAEALRAIVNYFDPIVYRESKRPPDLKWIAWSAI